MAAMGKARPVSQGSGYDKWVNERDQALERILQKYLSRLDISLVHLKTQVLEILSHQMIRSPGWIGMNAPEIESRVMHVLDQSAFEMTDLMTQMRASTYILSRTSESEALGRALQKNTQANIHANDLKEVMHETESPSGGSVLNRVTLSLYRLGRDVMSAYLMSRTLEEKPEEALKRVSDAFPRARSFQRPPRVLKQPRLKESADDGVPDDQDLMSFGYVSPEDWQKTLSDYLSDTLPNSSFGRTPGDQRAFFQVHDDGSVEIQQRHEWELEQEVTQDFVSRVRDGQVDAANENGIEDFQWVAVLDKKTDDCCSWRDGLTTSEIEQALESGKHSGDDSDATVPPAHFNCRCRMVPMSEDMPDSPETDFGSFDDWLDQKAAA